MIGLKYEIATRLPRTFPYVGDTTFYRSHAKLFLVEPTNRLTCFLSLATEVQVCIPMAVRFLCRLFQFEKTGSVKGETFDKILS